VQLDRQPLTLVEWGEERGEQCLVLQPLGPRVVFIGSMDCPPCGYSPQARFHAGDQKYAIPGCGRQRPGATLDR
jgi:hypothetical protein